MKRIPMAHELAGLYAAERERLCTACGTGGGDYENPVFGEGIYAPKLMLIGEAPGRDEAKLGRPFVGRAGKQLDALLEKAGILREQAFVTNAVKFRPVSIKGGRTANRTPSIREVREGLPLLARELACVKPVYAATLGNTPLKAICLLADRAPLPVGAVHGSIQMFSVNGTPLAVFPLYHPASVIYNPSLLPELEEDVLCLGSLLKEVKEA